jgi:hypothetical protein
MNAKQIIAAVAVALAGSSAIAAPVIQDALQTDISYARDAQAVRTPAPAAATSRAQATERANAGEAQRSRAQVRAEGREAAREAPRSHQFNELYAG